MKRSFLISAFLFSIFFQSLSQNEEKLNVQYDGMYIAKTGGVPAANIEIFTYLRFYSDGTVYLQSVTENDPVAVSAWFGKDKKYSQKGTYQITGSKILIQLNNKGTDDAKLEGKVETSYKGTIKQSDQICLIRDQEKVEICFPFIKTQPVSNGQ